MGEFPHTPNDLNALAKKVSGDGVREDAPSDENAAFLMYERLRDLGYNDNDILDMIGIEE